MDDPKTVLPGSPALLPGSPALLPAGFGAIHFLIFLNVLNQNLKFL